MEVDPTDWDLLAGMGSGAETGLEEAGIGTYEKAVAACNVLTTEKAASGAKYTLGDLSVFSCLSQHKEVIVVKDIPEPPPPVSVSDDLGLDVIDPAPVRLWHCATRMRRKTPARPVIASIMAWVLPELLRWSPVRAARSVRQCCRAFHARGGFLMASRIAECRRNIADSVASVLSFEAPLAAALLPKGVSKSILLRMLALAWFWLERCACGGADEHRMALAIVRLSVKFELKEELHEVALKLLGTKDEKTALHALECRLVMMLWRGGEHHVPLDLAMTVARYKLFLVDASRDAVW